jgi:glycosyltransferase involved in cell wall biosynthesis
LKKILIISEPFYPQVAAIGQLLTDLSEDLVKAGFQVKVVTGNPNNNFNKNNTIPRKENYKGIEIIRLRNTTFSKYRMIGRVINYLSFHFLVFSRVLFCERPDLVFVLSTPPFISFSGLMLKIFKKSKVIYNIQDLFPELAIELGKLRNKSLIFILKALSKYIIRKMDRVIVVGECMERKVKEELLKDMEVDHIVTIHNWADGEKLKVIGEEDNYLKKEWGLEGKLIVLYSGNMGYVHEFDTIISAAEDIQNKGYKNIIFVFIGEGIKKEYISKKAEEKGLNNILFFPYQPRDRLTYSLGLADISLVTLEEDFEGIVVPSKIYGILASGRPIIGIVGKDSEITEIIREGECGKVAKIGDWRALSETIIEYYKNPQKCKKEGIKGRRYFEENFDRKITTEKYIKVIDKTLNS